MLEQTTSTRILQKAQELVMHYGIRSVSMDDIAKALGISKKTIYQFYADKDELVAAVIKNKIEYSQNCCVQDKANAKDAVHEVFLAMQMVQDIMQNMNPSILYDMEKFHPKAYQIFYEHKHNFIYQMVKSNIERGIAEELYRSDLHVEILIKARIENIMFAFNQQVFPKNKFNLIQIETALTEHFLFGIASLKGHKLILKYQQQRLKNTTDDKKK
jgi:TetR/AcrR family transcriptional regulator, cholesterol catabolism regulator